jgi:hypothetical protein
MTSPLSREAAEDDRQRAVAYLRLQTGGVRAEYPDEQGVHLG